jgi:hypothetical protein
LRQRLVVICFSCLFAFNFCLNFCFNNVQFENYIAKCVARPSVQKEENPALSNRPDISNLVLHARQNGVCPLYWNELHIMTGLISSLAE